MILIDGFSQNLAMKMFTFKVDDVSRWISSKKYLELKNQWFKSFHRENSIIGETKKEKVLYRK